MEITSHNIYFKSVNHPVKPFKVKTADDSIYFNEIDYSKPPKKKVLKEIAAFFLDNFASTSAHPYWKTCRKGKDTFNKKEYNGYIKYDMETYKDALKSPDTTILLGRNKKKKLVAAVYTHPLNETPVINDDSTLYIDSIAVNKKYRGNHVGETVLNNVIDSTKDRYTDVFLVSYNESVPFYEKQGFKHVDNPFIIENMARERSDYPKYASFMDKLLDESQTRWYERL